MAKKKAKRKAVKKASISLIRPIFPKLVVQRITKGQKSKGGIIVTRLEQEETPYAVIFESGDNSDFKRGELVMIHAHCGHDFNLEEKGKDPRALTIIEPEDVVAKIEGTAKEVKEFVDKARSKV